MSAPAAQSGENAKPHAAVETQERPEKENGSPFQQQKMSHFFAQHNPPSTIICMFIVAIAFIPVGSAILVASESMYEKNIRYDNINSFQYGRCDHKLRNHSLGDGATFATTGCRARPVFTITSKVEGPVYMYYRLVNFYQNYRLYAKSINDNQIQGLEIADRADISDCWPFTGPGENDGTVATTLKPDGTTSRQYAEMQYSPCGTIAWSMFNDTIGLYKIDNASVVNSLAPTDEMPIGNGATLICDGGGFAANGSYVGGKAGNACSKRGIAFPSDVDTRFKTAHKGGKVWHGEGQAASTDVYQRNGWYANEMGHKLPLATDEDFIVWTRIAGLSDFRKLYRKIPGGLEAGTYALDVIEEFDVASFEGEKHIVLQTANWVGGRNLVLGSLFIAFGGTCLILGIAFLIWYVVSGPTRHNAEALMSSSASRNFNAPPAAVSRE